MKKKCRTKSRGITAPPWSRRLDQLDGSGLIGWNIRIDGRRTGMRLDAATWNALGEIAQCERTTLHELCTAVARQKTPALSLTVAMRAYALQYFRRKAVT
jgi:predicted DNA-binding ribbon-helix-helix protein